MIQFYSTPNDHLWNRKPPVLLLVLSRVGLDFIRFLCEPWRIGWQYNRSKLFWFLYRYFTINATGCTASLQAPWSWVDSLYTYFSQNYVLLHIIRMFYLLNWANNRSKSFFKKSWIFCFVEHSYCNSYPCSLLVRNCSSIPWSSSVSLTSVFPYLLYLKENNTPITILMLRVYFGW